ncbi:citrate/2-methylcitrate synthase [Microbacterium betulae]|uniref:citrate synthase (unknown stereospecificity) n=1 Tax=Microbacterium betulae TaxID=2981139 RepID=A0AA97FJK9_9MICO|nr:citrate/2-methylcitrate synthase [Microbacterium sp. AB]WOF22732.1 citrate/2-methylcitrate synthase [Microbacterium sp. AB]
MSAPPPRLTAGQAAARLGVKPETLYAYVSRGLIGRTRTASGSFFDPLEVEAFAVRRTRRATAASPDGARRSDGEPLMVLDTDIALVEDDELFLRGEPAARLAREQSFDAVAAWLWGERWDVGRRLRAPATFVETARGLVAALPSTASWIDRVVVAVRALATADPLRDDVGPRSLARVGEIVVAGIPRSLAPHAGIAEEASAPEALWQALTGSVPSPVEAAAVNAAMVLSVDHDLAVSTLAGRVAASARASGYAVVTSALGAFDSPLHGNASQAAAQLLGDVVGGMPADVAIGMQLRTLGRGAPGFGHSHYRGVDARAGALLRAIEPLDPERTVGVAVDALREAMRPTGLHPNLDLALAALTVAAGMPVDAGALVFATARVAGWIAHASDEYGSPPMRLRPRGRYTGPAPDWSRVEAGDG